MPQRARLNTSNLCTSISLHTREPRATSSSPFHEESSAYVESQNKLATDPYLRSNLPCNRASSSASSSQACLQKCPARFWTDSKHAGILSLILQLAHTCMASIATPWAQLASFLRLACKVDQQHSSCPAQNLGYVSKEKMHVTVWEKKADKEGTVKESWGRGRKCKERR